MTGGVVSAVEAGSVAHSLGIRPGDILSRINGHVLRDVLDVQFYAAEERLDLAIWRDGQELRLHARREYGRPLGLDFDSPVFDGLRHCDNHCDFCFVSQMPRGLRRSLYVRDDDYRYSVLYGNFITLTQLSSDDWSRLQEQRLSPLYLSVHATERSLRAELLGRPNVPDILAQIDRLAELSIHVHTQIVLVPERNDGPHLHRTLTDLADRYPTVQSIGIVPVGLTRYHRGSCRVYTPGEAREVVQQVSSFQEMQHARYGEPVAYLADEFYLLAGQEVPEDDHYGEYAQIENGIGLVRQFLDDSKRVRSAGSAEYSRITLVCGTLIAPLMRRVASGLQTRMVSQIQVLAVQNRLFGETVTVSGLLGGKDVLCALSRVDPGDLVVLPGAMFADPPDASGARAVSPVTLDDLALDELEAQLDRPVKTANWLSEIWS